MPKGVYERKPTDLVIPLKIRAFCSWRLTSWWSDEYRKRSAAMSDEEFWILFSRTFGPGGAWNRSKSNLVSSTDEEDACA